MSTIYLDPVAMDATAGLISDHVAEAEAAGADLETACSAQVPASLAGWLADELRDISVHVRMSALVYALAALDTALRAQQIQADQSLATATPALATTSPTFGPTVIGGFSAYGTPAPTMAELTGGSAVVGGFFLGASPGPGAVSMPGLSTEAFLANNPLLAAANNLQGTNPAAAGQLFGLHGSLSNSNAEMARAWTNSRPGASYIGEGLYKGFDGNVGPITSVYRNPDRPGEFRVG
jgi:hypothetical protein